MSEAEHEARELKDDAILAILGKLSLHYWRPDFTPEQAKHLYADYVEDLRPFALRDISNAASAYRRNGQNRFYPSSGALIDIIIGKEEVDARGYTDRFDALKRRRNEAIADGREELKKITAKIEASKPLPEPPNRPRISHRNAAE